MLNRWPLYLQVGLMFGYTMWFTYQGLVAVRYVMGITTIICLILMLIDSISSRQLAEKIRLLTKELERLR